MTNDATSGTVLVVTRELNASQEKVWHAWTDQESLSRWWGPKGMNLHVAECRVVPGGRFLYCMRPPEGQEMWGMFVYEDISPPERLVYISSFCDPEGNVIRAPFGGDFEHWPLEVRNTVTLTAMGDKTLLELRSVPINATDEERETFSNVLDNVRAGFSGTLDQLEEHLAS